MEFIGFDLGRPSLRQVFKRPPEREAFLFALSRPKLVGILR